MKRYVFAGASGRALDTYGRPIAERGRHAAKLVGVYDPNSIRARYVSQQCGGAPVYADFDDMLKETRPDLVVVTTMDRYHHDYIIRAMEAGCDVITEKPMTIDEEKVRAILEAEKRTGRKVVVTFNYRFQPYVTRVKELLRNGVIGNVLSVDFEWLLDTSHGADYFRRWHRRMENSGGLLVHKATHHFDMVNWWIDDEPEIVQAFGDLRFYGPTRQERGERCSTCDYSSTCEFYVDFTRDPDKKALYFEAEGEDGYYRDRCVFADEIDIYDTMSVSVRYQNGILLSYSLIAHSPYEGWRVALNGTGGRIELEEFHSGDRAAETCQSIHLFNRKDERVTYRVPKTRGGHGGGDVRLLRMLFEDGQHDDPLGHMAGAWAGAMSVLIGSAANRSIATGQSVRIRDLLLDPFGR